MVSDFTLQIPFYLRNLKYHKITTIKNWFTVFRSTSRLDYLSHKLRLEMPSNLNAKNNNVLLLKYCLLYYYTFKQICMDIYSKINCALKSLVLISKNLEKCGKYCSCLALWFWQLCWPYPRWIRCEKVQRVLFLQNAFETR